MRTIETKTAEKNTVRLSTAHSRELGEELRRIRRHAKLSSVEVAEALSWSLGKLSKLETGTRGTSTWEVATLVGRCGADKAARDRILALTSEPDTGSVMRLHDTVPDVLTMLAIHERTATSITAYEPFTVPALAQTRDYTRALTGDDDLVAARLARQREALCPLRRPRTALYVREAVLNAVVGDHTTMRDQLLHLMHMGDREHVTVRVIPDAVGPHPALLHPATLLALPAPQRPLAYAETDTATVFHDNPEVVLRYQHKMWHLRSLALSPGQSHALLARYADDCERRIR